MAFGTGLHPTTRSCLRLLQQVRPMPRCCSTSVRDPGSCHWPACCSAPSARYASIPIPWPSKRRAANAHANGLGDRVDARAGSLPAQATERFPLVVANLVASVLVELAPRLAAHAESGATLVASGIIDHRAGEVIAAFERVGLLVRERIDDDEWVSLRAERA